MKERIWLFKFTLVFIFAVGFNNCTHTSRSLINPVDFKDPPESVKIHTWWHWIDGNITKEGITKDLEAMKAQGIVQATILNVGLYTEKDFGLTKVEFGSDQWFVMFRWALQEANRLGITIGVHNCDGYSSSGGPWITPEMSMKQFVWTKTLVKGGKQINVNLTQPFSIQNFYRDVAVIAYKTEDNSNSFHLEVPQISWNDSTDASVLMDGNPVSGILMKDKDYLKIATSSPLTIKKIAIHPRKSFLWWMNADDFESTFTLAASPDGKQYKKVSDIVIKGVNNTYLVDVPVTTAKYFRVSLNHCSSFNQDVYPYYLTELELLKKDEKPLFSPNIPFISEKTISVKSESKNNYYTCGSDLPVNNISSEKDVLVLTDKMKGNGTLQWNSPEGNWTILRFGYTTTGVTNGPATKKGVGLECDKMDTSALNLHFRNFPQKLITNAGNFKSSTFKFLLIDSWEAAYQNWTANFPAEFEKRRGYSLLPWLPVLCGEIIASAAESEALLFDFRKTIAELIEQNYYEHLSDLCHKENLELHAEVYGGSNWPPLDVLKTNKFIDLPMSEFWASPDNNNFITYTPQPEQSLNISSSAAIGYNKPLMGAEAYTGIAHYSESPYDLKPFGDLAFCSGVNQMVLHSYVHQPTDKKPGMTLEDWASHFNRNNLYWPYISEWFNYQSRIQYVLQKGVTAPDVLYYLGDQLPEFYVNNQSTTLPFGYQVNACNFDILKNRVAPIDGKLRMNKVTDYSLLSLPAYPYMDYETLKLIESLVKAGAMVYGPKPLYTLSKVDLTDNVATFHELAEKVWGKVDGKTVKENNYGKGKVFWGMPIGEVLVKINLAPDFATNQPEKKTFQFIHKKIGDMDVYFVANQLDSSLNRECLFRVGEKTPEIWNPEDGSVVKPAIFRMENGSVRIPFNFKPYQSTLFVFKPGKPADFITEVSKDGNQIFPASKGEEKVEVPLVTYQKDGILVIAKSSGNYVFNTQNRKSISGKYEQPKEMEINNFKGTIQFEPGYPGTIAPIEIGTLRSLTDFENSDIKYFSGNAKYTINFNVPKEFTSEQETWLDMGNFEAVAEVTLNGKPLGKIWKPGTKLSISGLLKADNQLVVTVANVYRNRFIGDFAQYGKVQNLWTTAPISEFLDKDKPLKPSGLMGPLKIFINSNRQVIKDLTTNR